jgi:hypothetical protein
VEALSGAESEQSQLVRLRLALDAFCHDLEVQAVAEPDDRLGDGRTLRRPVELGDEVPIELEQVDRQPGEIAQR